MLWSKYQSILMAAANERGGGGGNGKGKKDDDSNDDENTETEDERIGRIVNAAVSSQLKRGGVKEQINAAVQAAITPAMEQLTKSITETLRGGQGNDDGGGDKGKGNVSPEMQKRLDDLERSNKRLTDENEKSKGEAARERLANQQAEERQLLRKELVANGVSEDRVDGALALLYTERKKLKRDGEGKIRYSTIKDGYAEDVDVSVGVGEWVKSSEGKAYLPADNVQGTGTRGGRPAPRGKGEPSEMELLTELGNQLMGQPPTIKLG